jgi:hypothetical protein
MNLYINKINKLFQTSHATDTSQFHQYFQNLITPLLINKNLGLQPQLLFIYPIAKIDPKALMLISPILSDKGYLISTN